MGRIMAPARGNTNRPFTAALQHPYVRLAFGIVTAALGAVVIVWPGHPVVIVSVLFGAQLIVSAILRFIATLASTASPQWMRAANLVGGVIALLAGIFFLRHPYSLGEGIVLLGIVLGIYWIVTGAIDLFIVLSQQGVARRRLSALTAVLSLAAGIIVIAYPSESIAIIAWVLGGFLLVFGVITIVHALLLRQRGALAA